MKTFADFSLNEDQAYLKDLSKHILSSDLPEDKKKELIDICNNHAEKYKLESDQVINQDYNRWITWAKESGNQIQPLTKTQWKFAEFLLKNKEELIKIGDLLTVFKSVSKFLKS